MNIQGYCLISGASHGIGRAVAYEWASKGVSILAIAIDHDGLLSLKDDLESKYNISCKTLTLDLLKPQSSQEILEYCFSNNIKIQILMNNVGLGFSGSFEETDIHFDLDLVKLNLFPMLQLTKLFLPHLKEFDKSYILNMGSLGSYSPVPYKALYSASKAFIYSFSNAISYELKETSVQVSVACPPGVYTNTEVVDRIKASGTIGKLTSLYGNSVAKYIVAGMLEGKTVIIPGKGAKILMILTKLLPSFLNRWLVARNMKKHIRAN